MSSAPEPTSTSAQEQREFRDYARRWLRENAPPPAPVRLPLSAIEVMTEPQRDYLQAWQKKCHEAGLVGCDYPKAYGGGGHTGFQRIANQELGPQSDFTEIVKLLERWAGVEVKGGRNG